MTSRTECGLSYEHPKHGFQRNDEEAMEICSGKLSSEKVDAND